MPGTYRTPTAAESAKLEKSRKMMREGIEGEKSMTAKLLPTMAKSARDEQRMAKRMRESVDPRAREGEAYNQAGYRKGGKVKGGVTRADGCAVKGRTRGRKV
jgi:rubrerythrin